jgi:RNA polymerase sigma factor FliA
MYELTEARSEAFEIADEFEAMTSVEGGVIARVGRTPGISDPGDADAARVDRACRELHYLLRRVAGRFVRRLPSHIEIDELVAAGAEGLLLAVRQHLDKPEVELKRLAVRRIRGAMLDYLRGADYLTRRQRAAVGALQKTREHLERSGEVADLPAMAASMGVSVGKVQELQDGLASVQVLGLPPGDTLVDPGPDPFTNTEDRQGQRILAAALQKLPERLQVLLSLYYYEDLTYQEISETLNISRSRICQLHSQAMELLRKHLGDVAAA